MSYYSIYPLWVGEMQCAEKSNSCLQKDQGVKIKTPLISYLIKGKDTLILVDTGAPGEEWAEKYHHPMVQTKDMRLVNRLKAMGITPDDIKIVINTHLHWDHCFANDLFKKAKIYVQRKEIEAALSPIPSQYVYYEAYQIGMTPAWTRSANLFEIVDGDYQLQEGIKLVTLPGHTTGFQGVLVDTQRGRYLIASDCIPLLENWEERPYGIPRPSGIHVDLTVYYETLKKMVTMCNYVLPGHDHRALDHKVYPVADNES